jgi:hypothetical protein
LNKLNIGDGHILRVVKADFKAKVEGVSEELSDSKSTFATESKNIQFTKSTHTLKSVDLQALPALEIDIKEIRKYIPTICELEKYPVVVAFNTYDETMALHDEGYATNIEVCIAMFFNQVSSFIGDFSRWICWYIVVNSATYELSNYFRCQDLLVPLRLPLN